MPMDFYYRPRGGQEKKYQSVNPLIHAVLAPTCTKRQFKETKCVEVQIQIHLSQWIFHEPSLHLWWVGYHDLYHVCISCRDFHVVT